MITLVLLAGCVPDGDVSGSSADLVVTSRCEVAGLGVLPSGDLGAGRIDGGDTGATGDWLHISVTEGIVLATPDWVLCRINGATLGDFGGSATMNGVSGFTYRVSVQDRGTPGDRTIVPGTPTVETVTATQRYRPVSWTDGALPIRADWARVTIPAELPVTSGVPGRGYAEVVFTRADTLDTVRCEYRGNGARGHYDDDDDDDHGRGRRGHHDDDRGRCGDHDDDRCDHDGDHDGDHGDHDDDDDDDDDGDHDDDDDDDDDDGDHDDDDDDDDDDDGEHGGDRYVLQACHVLPGLPPVAAGDAVDVTSLSVGVRNGARRWRRGAGETTVTVNFDVTPLTVIEPERDYYRIAVFDAAGDRALLSEGTLASGDYVVQILP